ncbi:hypothetical protein P3S67_013281 [Capsicum chacoense]
MEWHACVGLSFLGQVTTTSAEMFLLGNNSFTGSIPSSFSNISKLETLILKFNSVEGQIPKVIGSLVNHRVLNLGGNKLIGFFPTSLSNASRLETLEISDNSLQGNIPGEIGNLHSMNLLSIQYNQLTGIIPLSAYQEVFLMVYAILSEYSKAFICLLTSFVVICLQACQIVHNFNYWIYRKMSLMDQYVVK